MKPPSKEFQEFHVKGIRAILAHPKGCTRCPQGPINPFIEPPVGNDMDSCDMCRDFQDMISTARSCPCGSFKEKALIRAQHALNRWDKGTHKWQKGNRE